jgi:hypothetical protein
MPVGIRFSTPREANSRSLEAERCDNSLTLPVVVNYGTPRLMG